MKTNAKIIIILLIFIPTTISPTNSRLAPKWTDFFKITTGISEEDFATKSFNQQKKDLLEEEDFKKNAGTYYEFSVKYLREKTKDMPALQQQGFFKILYNIPIQELLDDDQFKYAAFQSASTIQALEGGMWSQKKKLNDMQQHAVQGETLAFCTLYGNIQRKYYYNYILKNFGIPKDWKTKAQSNDDFKQIVDSYSNIPGSDPWKFGINLLSAYGKFDIKHGEIKNLPNPYTNQDEYEKVKIGYQYETKVSFKGDKNNIIKTKNRAGEILSNQALIKQNKDFWVDQVISFAINLNQNQISNYNTNSQYNIDIAKQILFATYEAAIRSSFYKGRKKILLTAVGAGAFKNKSKWVADAIGKMSDFIVDKNMQVYLVLFDPRKKLNPIKIYDDLEKKINKKFENDSPWYWIKKASDKSTTKTNDGKTLVYMSYLKALNEQPDQRKNINFKDFLKNKEAIKNNLKFVEWDIDAKNEEGKTALHYAIERGNLNNKFLYNAINFLITEQ